MQRIDAPTTITIDGTVHEVSKFSDTVKRLVDIHTEWRNELAEQRLAVAKTEAAIRSLDAELTQTIAKELNPEPAAEVVEATPAQ